MFNFICNRFVIILTYFCNKNIRPKKFRRNFAMSKGTKDVSRQIFGIRQTKLTITIINSS